VYERAKVRRQIGLFLLSVSVAAICLAVRWGLYRARLASYERLDEQVGALLDRGNVQQARRLVSEAIETCRRLGFVQSSVYAAAALLYGPKGLNDPLISARYVEAAMEQGLSVADNPALRALYAGDLAALKRWSDLVELYAAYPQETLFSEEHRLLIRAFQQLGLMRRAYAAVLRALTCPLDRETSLELWQLRGKLAARLGLVDCWAGVDGARLSPEEILVLAECELNRLTGGPEATVRAARRLLGRFSARPELLARAHAFLFLLLRESGSLAAARNAAHAVRALAAEANCGELCSALLEWEYGRPEPDVVILSELIVASCAADAAPASTVLHRALRCYTLRSLASRRPLDPRTVDAVLRVLGGTATANCLVDAVSVLVADGGNELEYALEEVDRVLSTLRVDGQGTWRFRLASWFAERGNYARAVDLVGALEGELADAEQLLAVARWSRAAGDWDAQMRFARRAVRRAGETGVRLRAELELGLGQIQAGNYGDAERVLSRALSEAIFASAQEREVVQGIRVALALALAGQGKTRSALGFLEEWIDEGGHDSARGHFLYAVLLYLDAERAYRMDTTSVRASRGESDVYVERARDQWLRVAGTAIAVLDRFGSQLTQEEIDQLRVVAARALVVLGEHERALVLLEPVVKSSNPWAFEAALERANCLWHLGRRKEAQACLAELSRWKRGNSVGPNGGQRMVPLAAGTLRRLF